MDKTDPYKGLLPRRPLFERQPVTKPVTQSVTEPVTEKSVTQSVTQKSVTRKPGRKPKGETAMSQAERAAAYRARKRLK